MISVAALLALSMQCASTVHPDTSHDVARVESGLNPFAIGVVGNKGLFPENINDALAHIDQLKARGKNYSVGLMQINQANFSRYGVTAKQLFNPCTNLTVFEKIITDCYLHGGTLKRALSCYYSGNFNTGKKKEKSFGNTSYVQRIGYVVPSTKEDKQSEPEKINISTFYPHEVVRGDVIDSTKLETETIKYPAHIVRGDFVITETKETNK